MTAYVMTAALTNTLNVLLFSHKIMIKGDYTSFTRADSQTRTKASS